MKLNQKSRDTLRVDNYLRLVRVASLYGTKKLIQNNSNAITTTNCR